jgi:hypothetical protein
MNYESISLLWPAGPTRAQLRSEAAEAGAQTFGAKLSGKERLSREVLPYRDAVRRTLLRVKIQPKRTLGVGKITADEGIPRNE